MITSSKLEQQLARVKVFFTGWQAEICAQIASLEDSQNFVPDDWQYAAGNGGGSSCVLSGGEVIEQGGVNFSHISGDCLPKAATLKRPQLQGASFQALGTSVVMHPGNPFCPTSHANLRFFVAQRSDSVAVWWFGGGFDLTPYYGFKEDAVLWHQHALRACDKFGGAEIYKKYKKNCDDYFYLPHRAEQRGIGGLFFDDLNHKGFDECFDFVQKVAEHYLAAYMTLLIRRKDHAYNDRQRHFQCYRRGRYVEFNLLHDRGTLFGLQSGGRTESILMSLPPEVRWRYNYHPEVGTAERELYDYFLQPRDWLAEVGSA